MPNSMTAFGRGQATAGEGAWVVELRTVNSRFLDTHFRLAPVLAGLEERFKKALSKRLKRGRVNLMVKASGAAEAAPRLVLNRPLAAEYKRVLSELKDELGITEEPGLAAFIGNRDLILAEEASPDLDQLWEQVRPALEQALDEACRMRGVEGKSLAADLTERLEILRGLFQKVADMAPMVVEDYRRRLNERLTVLLDNPEPDPQRLAFEVAVMADKCDVAEEAVRAQSHLGQFADILASNGPVGRKLDFLLQELNREANTMGSKLPDAQAAQVVVEIKAELERIREQVQNIE